MTQRVLVLATRNPGKAAELRDILAEVLADTGYELVGVAELPSIGLDPVEDVVETGVTFAENATLKAEAVTRATGLPALADDSGLAVDVLGGSPGVFSARWSGPKQPGQDGGEKDRANTALLLGQVQDVPAQHRGAGFVCAAALSAPGRATVVREGHCRGHLGTEPVGEHGFGYDPVLVMDDGRTLAQYAPEEKNAISHRGAAFRALAADVRDALTG